jgi:uncharacterized protein
VHIPALLTEKEVPIYYWSLEKVRSEIDFLMEYEGELIPLEINVEENLHAKSLRLFCK